MLSLGLLNYGRLLQKMANILLNNNNGFSWFSNEMISVKGCFFDTQNNFYEKEKTILFFEGIVSESQFIDKIKEVNGFFTVLIKFPNSVFMAAGATRKFPLFYSYKNKELSISDDILFLKKNLKISKIDKQSALEFKASGYTMGNRTLVKNVYQLQSNEYLIFKNKTIGKQGFFFNYATKNINKITYPKLKEQAISAFDNAFKRLIISLNNRPVVLPLSGGYDSRLIAVMLRKYNYENVICYTYGKKGNYEIENSKKTADALNFKWIFIEYTEELMNNYIDSEIFKEFAHYTCKYTSMPSLQDYFAVKYLTDSSLIASDSIFIPGYAGDLLGGSQYAKIIPNNLKVSDISNLILKEKFFHNKVSKNLKKIIKNNIDELLYNFDVNYTNKIASTVFENYDIKEKISKIIFKASNLYTFFGYEHRFPYWDMELLKFFKEVPPKYKKVKFLYDDVLKNHYFEMFNVNFEKEIQPSLYNLNVQKIKERIKPFLPYFILKKFLIKNDWVNYNYVTSQMVKSMNENDLKYHSKVRVYNEFNIQWYLYFSMGLIKSKS